MNKGDLVEAVVKVVGSKKLAEETVVFILESISNRLVKNFST